MNCSLDLTHPRESWNACVDILVTTPNWPQLLAYGVATAAIIGFVIVTMAIVMRRGKE